MADAAAAGHMPADERERAEKAMIEASVAAAVANATVERDALIAASNKVADSGPVSKLLDFLYVGKQTRRKLFHGHHPHRL